MEKVAPHVLFWYLAGVLAAVCLFTAIRMLMRRALSPEAQGNYVPSPVTPISASSQGAPELDPRSPHRSAGTASQPGGSGPRSA